MRRELPWKTVECLGQLHSFVTFKYLTQKLKHISPPAAIPVPSCPRCPQIISPASQNSEETRWSPAGSHSGKSWWVTVTSNSDFAETSSPPGTGKCNSQPLVMSIGLENPCYLHCSPTYLYTLCLVCLFSVVLSLSQFSGSHRRGFEQQPQNLRDEVASASPGCWFGEP